MHNTAVSVNVKINAPIANGTTIGALCCLCIQTPQLSYRYDSQGSHRSPKVLNVLEFDFSIRVPSNVLEFH